MNVSNTGNVLSSLLQNPAASGGKSASLNGGAGFAYQGTSDNPASTDNVELSPRAQALLNQADAAIISGNAGAAERLQKRIDAFASKLSDFYKRNSIPVDEKTVFNISASGDITVDTAYKKKFTEYLRDNPDAATELKKIAKLSALQATQKALELYYEEKKAAKGDKDKEAIADERYKLRTKKIGELAGTLTFENGKLTSAAAEYASTLLSRAPYEIPQARVNVAA